MSAVLEGREPSVLLLENVQPALVEHFDVVASAPGGVARLRDLILTLAVRGKLVRQDPTDEPASALLARTKNKKNLTGVEGPRRRDKPTGKIETEEAHFDLPAGWEWVRLADVVRILNGRAYSKHELLERGATPVLRVGNLFTSDHWYYSNLELEADKYCCSGDLLFAWSASFGPFIWSGPKAIFHYHIWKLTPINPSEFDSRYLHTFLQEKTAEIKAAGHGVSMVHMTKEKMEQIVVPYPPLAEQSRIVARVGELMRLCSALEARVRLEADQHEQLLNILLDALTASASPEELSANWQRVATIFDLLIDRPEAVDALEQTMLQLAVRGLLVLQDATEEPASELLRRIAIEKDYMVAQGVIGRIGPIEPVSSSEEAFTLPRGWVWARLGDLVSSSEAGWSPSCHPTPRRAGRWGVLKVSAVSWGSFDPDANKELPEGLAARAELEVKPGDFLLSRANTEELVGRSVVVADTPPQLMLSDKVIRLNVSTHANREFLSLSNNAAHTRSYYAARATGTSRSMKNVSRHIVLAAPIAVPPAGEQARIMARVEQLRSLCADLRDRLAKSRLAQARVADAMVESAGAAGTPSVVAD